MFYSESALFCSYSRQIFEALLWTSGLSINAIRLRLSFFIVLPRYTLETEIVRNIAKFIWFWPNIVIRRSIRFRSTKGPLLPAKRRKCV